MTEIEQVSEKEPEIKLLKTTSGKHLITTEQNKINKQLLNEAT